MKQLNDLILKIKIEPSNDLLIDELSDILQHYELSSDGYDRVTRLLLQSFSHDLKNDAIRESVLNALGFLYEKHHPTQYINNKIDRFIINNLSNFHEYEYEYVRYISDHMKKPIKEKVLKYTTSITGTDSNI